MCQSSPVMKKCRAPCSLLSCQQIGKVLHSGHDTASSSHTTSSAQRQKYFETRSGTCVRLRGCCMCPHLLISRQRNDTRLSKRVHASLCNIFIPVFLSFFLHLFPKFPIVVPRRNPRQNPNWSPNGKILFSLIISQKLFHQHLT
jgi:hypothetical protein